jgi:hypothetical protein|nr:MAG TPA: hypothetical protein [Caudoviricetes sp.]
MNNEEIYIQYTISYKKNNKWYRDNERHQNLKTANERLEKLKPKYEECKIVWRKITGWKELENVKD